MRLPKEVDMTYRIESDYPLSSDWLPASAFTAHYEDKSTAVATAIDGMDDPGEQEVRAIRIETGEVVWRSIEDK